MKSRIVIVLDFITDFFMLFAIIGLVINNKALTLTFITLFNCTKTIMNYLMLSILSEKENDKKNGTDN